MPHHHWPVRPIQPPPICPYRHVHRHSLAVGFLTPQIAWEFFAREKLQSQIDDGIPRLGRFLHEVTPHKHRYNGQDLVSCLDYAFYKPCSLRIRQCDVQEEGMLDRYAGGGGSAAKSPNRLRHDARRPRLFPASTTKKLRRTTAAPIDHRIRGH